MMVIGGVGSRCPRDDVDDDVSRRDALDQRLGTGALDRRQSVAEHHGEDLRHLPVAVVGACELAADAIDRLRQHPVLERRAVAQRTGLAGEDRHVVPGIADGGAAAEDAAMLGDDAAVLADHHAVGIRLDLDGSSDGAGADRVLVVVEAHEAGLRDRCR